MPDIAIPSEGVLLRSVAERPLGGFDEDLRTSSGAIYLRYAPILRRIASRKYDVPIADVDAVVHDVFATYLTNPTAVRDVRAYLIGGICNASRDYWRKRRREVPLSAAEEVGFDEQLFAGLSERLSVAATVARLRSRCREVLRRYYFEGDTKEAIAEAISTTPRNVLYLLHACRLRARKIYETLTKVL